MAATSYTAEKVRGKWRVVDEDGKVQVTVEEPAGVDDEDRKALAELLAKNMTQMSLWS